MKQTRFLFSGIVFLVLATAPLGWATSSSTGKAHNASAKAAHHSGMARNPYLGAIVVDAASGKVLFEDQADVKGYPASMQKLMDLLIVLEKIEHGQLSLQDQVPVSAK